MGVVDVYVVAAIACGCVHVGAHACGLGKEKSGAWCDALTHVNICEKTFYEGCSNMNASSFITFVTYMLRQNGKRFYKGLYVTFKLAPNRKKNTIYLSSYSPLNEGHFSILTN